MGLLTSQLPKPLIEIAGATLLERLVRTLHAADVTEVLVVTGWQARMISATISDSSVMIKESNDWERGPLFTLLNGLEFTDWDSFLLCPADLLTTPENITGLLKAHSEADSTLTLAVDSVSVDENPLYIDESNRFLIMNSSPETPSLSVRSAQLLMCESDFVEHARSGADQGITTVAVMIDSYIKTGLGVRAFRVTPGSWLDVDRLASIIQANRWALQKLSWSVPDAFVVLGSDKMEFESSISLPGNVQIAAGTSVTGPVYIGSGSRIEQACQIGPFVSLGATSHIEENVKLKDTVAFRHAKLKRNTHLEQAIVVSQEILQEDSD
jgi:NDP-sugar pyrophosphorylase family protein